MASERSQTTSALPKSPAERPSSKGSAEGSDEKVSMVTASVVIEPPAAQMDSGGSPKAAASTEARRVPAGNEVRSCPPCMCELTGGLSAFC